MLYSYLEDIIPRISYIASSAKPAQKQTEEQLKNFREFYESHGLDQKSVRSLETLVRSARIDYQARELHTIWIQVYINLVLADFFCDCVHCCEQIRRGDFNILTWRRRNITMCASIKGVGRWLDIGDLYFTCQSVLERTKSCFSENNQKKDCSFNQRSGGNISPLSTFYHAEFVQTSITIDDVVYVIDTGKVKETFYDPETGLSGLAETWVTKAAARQRRGRAGRTRPGECYKLYTREQEQQMGDFPVPEILRIPLESLSLAVKTVRENADVKVGVSQLCWHMK